MTGGSNRRYYNSGGSGSFTISWSDTGPCRGGVIGGNNCSGGLTINWPDTGPC